jgi:hypothetical protein
MRDLPPPAPEDASAITRTFVRQGAWSRVSFVAISILIGALGALVSMPLISLWTDDTDLEFSPGFLVGPCVLVVAAWGLWKGLMLRPGSILFEIDGSGIVLHVSPRMRKLETPVVLSWTDIATIRAVTGRGIIEEVYVQSRDGVWYQLPVRLSSPCPQDVIKRMLALVKDQGIRAERKYRFLVLSSRTEWRLSTP